MIRWLRKRRFEAKYNVGEVALVIIGFWSCFVIQKWWFFLTATHFVVAENQWLKPVRWDLIRNTDSLSARQRERVDKTYNDSVSVDSEGNDKIAF